MTINKPRILEQTIARGRVTPKVRRQPRVDHDSPRPIDNILDGSFCHPIGLWHARLGELMPSPGSQVRRCPDYLIGIIRMNKIGADRTQEILQGFMYIQCTLARNGV